MIMIGKIFNGKRHGTGDVTLVVGLTFVIVLLLVGVADARPQSEIHSGRQKRFSDQKILDIEARIALAKLRGRPVMGSFGKIDPGRIGRARRSSFESDFQKKLLRGKLRRSDDDNNANNLEDADSSFGKNNNNNNEISVRSDDNDDYEQSRFFVKLFRWLKNKAQETEEERNLIEYEGLY